MPLTTTCRDSSNRRTMDETETRRRRYVVIAFDASYQGGSGGEPRFTEDPWQRVADFSHVIDYLVTVPYVDADRIGVLGVCGGGYSIAAAKTERRSTTRPTAARPPEARRAHSSPVVPRATNVEKLLPGRRAVDIPVVRTITAPGRRGYGRYLFRHDADA